MFIPHGSVWANWLLDLWSSLMTPLLHPSAPPEFTSFPTYFKITLRLHSCVMCSVMWVPFPVWDYNKHCCCFVCPPHTQVVTVLNSPHSTLWLEFWLSVRFKMTETSVFPSSHTRGFNTIVSLCLSVVCNWLRRSLLQPWLEQEPQMGPSGVIG